MHGALSLYGSPPLVSPTKVPVAFLCPQAAWEPLAGKHPSHLGVPRARHSLRSRVKAEFAGVRACQVMSPMLVVSPSGLCPCVSRSYYFLPLVTGGNCSSGLSSLVTCLAFQTN